MSHQVLNKPARLPFLTRLPTLPPLLPWGDTSLLIAGHLPGAHCLFFRLDGSFPLIALPPPSLTQPPHCFVVTGASQRAGRWDSSLWLQSRSVSAWGSVAHRYLLTGFLKCGGQEANGQLKPACDPCCLPRSQGTVPKLFLVQPAACSPLCFPPKGPHLLVASPHMPPKQNWCCVGSFQL